MWRLAFQTCMLAAVFWTSTGHGLAWSYQEGRDRLMVLDLSVNSQRLSVAQEVGLSASGRWSIPMPLWTQLRLRVMPDMIKTGVLEGHAWADAIPGAQLEFDPESQTLSIMVPASAFDIHRVGADNPGHHARSSTDFGAYANYDVFARHHDGRTRWNGGIEWLGFGPGVHVKGTHFYRGHVTGSGRWVRLDTTAELYDAAEMRSLRLGDQVTSAGLWGLSMRIGGIGFGTRFALQPDFVAHALPSVRGEALLPSTMDLLVDGRQVATQNVPAGPFEWHRLPVLTGRGDLLLQVTDLLGRKVDIVQPYLVSSQLMQDGLADFSVEAGRVREDYGLRSTVYGRHVLVGQYRRGLSGQLTSEVRAEYLSGQVSLGVGAVWKLADLGVMQATAAVSERDRVRGHAWSLGFDVPARLASLQYRTSRSSPHFVQLGADNPQSIQRATHRVSVLLPWSRGGAGLTWVSRRYWAADPQRFWILSASASFGSRFFLSAFLQESRFGRKRRTIGVSLVLPLQHNAQSWIQASRSTDHHQAGAGWTTQVPTGPGWGHRLFLSHDRHLAARLDRRGPTADWRAELDVRGEQVHVGTGLSGSLVFLGGRVRPARRIEGSFALLKVGDVAGVPVYRDQHKVGVTDADGLIVLNDLRPHQTNVIHIDPNDLPMDASFEHLQLKLSPGLGSGVFADMRVRRVRSQTITLYGPDGKMATAGTPVRAMDDGSVRVVGYDGKLYEPDWVPGRIYEGVLAGRPCRFQAPEPARETEVDRPAAAFCLEEQP